MNNTSCAYAISAILLSTLIMIAEKAIWLYERDHGGVGWSMWESLPIVIWVCPLILIILAIVSNSKTKKK